MLTWILCIQVCRLYFMQAVAKTPSLRLLGYLVRLHSVEVQPKSIHQFIFYFGPHVIEEVIYSLFDTREHLRVYNWFSADHSCPTEYLLDLYLQYPPDFTFNVLLHSVSWFFILHVYNVAYLSHSTTELILEALDLIHEPVFKAFIRDLLNLRL